jgi:ribosomal protein S18 acetylase RimI-like enzyme
MKLAFSIAERDDVPELTALHNAAADDLTRRYGHGVWSTTATEKGVLFRWQHVRVLIARKGERIAGTLRLQTKKPWAIDVGYFTPVKKAIYLTGMAVIPAMQHKGVGTMLLEEAARHAIAWPADAIRLDAFDTDAGAGGFYAGCGFCEVGRVTYRKSPLIYYERVLV